MMPTHHPDPDELMAYAGGTSPEWMSLIVACHLTFCEQCREDIALFDDLGGALLDELPGDLGGRLVLPETLPPPRSVVAAPGRALPDIPGVPRPVLPYIAEGPEFRFLIPYVQHVPLSLKVNDVPARLVRFEPGVTIPQHSHNGLEMILVFDGEFEDSETNERYRSGDLSRREGTAHHTTRITSPDACIALVVGTSKSTPHTLWGKIAQLRTKI